MSNVYKFDNLEDLLQCPICLDRYQVPKVLSCQHTFCLQCLQRAYDTQHRTLTCPTCRRVMRLAQGPDELPSHLLLISLLDVQPVKGKCPCCDKVEILTICEHCHSTKCTNCNEKHIKDIRQSTRTIIDELENTNQDNLKVSIHDAFKSIRNEICNQFKFIRQQQDSILLTKRLHILKQLDTHEQTLLKHVENDLQLLEQSKLEITRKNYDLESKSEPELINLSAKVSELKSNLADKLTEHQKYINSIEISLQYDQDQLDQINQMCDHMQLNVTHTNESTSNQRVQFTVPSESFYITLRTFLNQEYKCRVTLDQTILELKQILGKQENLDPHRITLTKSGNFFHELDDNRTLKSYNCDASTGLMICIR